MLEKAHLYMTQLECKKVNISNVTKHAHSNGYQVIFIHLIGSLDMSLRQNIQRNEMLKIL
jgi:hypothetical protein